MACRAMTDEFQFRLIAADGNARRGEISMPRGVVRTPAFMPVGTAGTVKAMYMDQVRDLGSCGRVPSASPGSGGSTNSRAGRAPS